MTKTPDYQRYTMDELLDVQVHIDRDRFPERYEMLCAEIQRRREHAAQQMASPSSPPATSPPTSHSPAAPDLAATASAAPTPEAPSPLAPSRQTTGSSAHTYTPHWLPLVAISAVLMLALGGLYFGFVREPIQEVFNDHNAVVQALRTAYPDENISVTLQNNTKASGIQMVLGLNAQGASDSGWAQLSETEAAGLVMTAYNAYPNPQQIGEIAVAYQSETDLGLISTKQTDYVYRYNRSDLMQLKEVAEKTK